MGSDRDEDLLALGRYMAEFSQMVAEMRLRMVFRLQQPRNPPALAWIVFAGAGPREIKTAFFAMARLLTEHDAEEDRVAVRLERRVEREIAQRNLIAHGDLQIGWWQRTEGQPPEPLPTAIERLTASGFSVTQPDLQARCEAITLLTRMLWQYGTVCMTTGSSRSAPQRVSDRAIVKCCGSALT